MPLVLVILGFICWWPLGLIALGFLIARHKYGCWRGPIYAGNGPMSDWDCRMDRWEDRLDRKMARMQDKVQRVRAQDGALSRPRRLGFGPSSSGNRAFDDYRAETLKRLEDEQREFKEFLERLRFAKDRAEFDQFMDERRERPFEPGAAPGPAEEPPHA